MDLGQKFKTKTMNSILSKTKCWFVLSRFPRAFESQNLQLHFAQLFTFLHFCCKQCLVIFVGSKWNFKRKNYFLQKSFLFTQIKNNWFYPWYPIAKSAAKECCWKQQKEHVGQKHDVVFINKKEKYFQNKKLVFGVFVHELNSWKWSNSGNIHDWKKLRQKLCFQFIKVFSNHLFRFFFCASLSCR